MINCDILGYKDNASSSLKDSINPVDEELRYSISLLNGGELKTYEENRLAWSIEKCEEFKKLGQVRQSRILRTHLNRYLKTHPYLLENCSSTLSETEDLSLIAEMEAH